MKSIEIYDLANWGMVAAVTTERPSSGTVRWYPKMRGEASMALITATRPSHMSSTAGPYNLASSVWSVGSCGSLEVRYLKDIDDSGRARLRVSVKDFCNRAHPKCQHYWNDSQVQRRTFKVFPLGLERRLNSGDVLLTLVSGCITATTFILLF